MQCQSFSSHLSPQIFFRSWLESDQWRYLVGDRWPKPMSAWCLTWIRLWGTGQYHFHQLLMFFSFLPHLDVLLTNGSLLWVWGKVLTGSFGGFSSWGSVFPYHILDSLHQGPILVLPWCRWQLCTGVQTPFTQATWGHLPQSITSLGCESAQMRSVHQPNNLKSALHRFPHESVQVSL